MNWRSKSLWLPIQIVCMAALVIIAISFVNRKQEETVYKDLLVSIEDRYENFFVDEEDVIAMITDNGEKVFEGKFITELDIKLLEDKVKNESFIKDAEVYRDLKGNVLVRATQRRPIARIISESGNHRYIAADGTVLPVSRKYTAKVVLIRGLETLKPGDNILNMEETLNLMDVLEFIYKDEFWKAQITEIEIQRNGDLILYTQVSRQYVEFGKPEIVENKFARLKIFYKDILPRKGWNVYERVNLKFKDQIICE